jgi:hypothetical protein
MDNRTFTRVLLALIAAEILAVILASAVCADWPALPSTAKSWPPIPHFNPTPACKSEGGVFKIEVPVTAEVRREPVKKAVKAFRNWVVVGSRPGPCPTCPPQDVYGWRVETEDGSKLTIEQAAFELAKGGLGPEETNRLSHIIDAPARALAKLGQHFGPGSCGMLDCDTHPMVIVPAGVETQEELDARTVPWGDEGGQSRRQQRKAERQARR